MIKNNKEISENTISIYINQFLALSNNKSFAEKIGADENLLLDNIVKYYFIPTYGLKYKVVGPENLLASSDKFNFFRYKPFIGDEMLTIDSLNVADNANRTVGKINLIFSIDNNTCSDKYVLIPINRIYNVLNLHNYVKDCTTQNFFTNMPKITCRDIFNKLDDYNFEMIKSKNLLKEKNKATKSYTTRVDYGKY